MPSIKEYISYKYAKYLHKKKRYICDICKKRFKSINLRTEHYYKKHNPQKL